MTLHDPTYRLIPLTKRQVAIVDVEDYERLKGFKWYAQWSESTMSFYACRARARRDGGRHVSMHREILGLQLGDVRQAEHRFHNTLDNRKFIEGQENLRIATCSNNQCNKGITKRNTTGFKGVDFQIRYNNYRARITVSGAVLTLGYRATAREAHEELYVPAALNYHGKFAKTT